MIKFQQRYVKSHRKVAPTPSHLPCDLSWLPASGGCRTIAAQFIGSSSYPPTEFLPDLEEPPLCGPNRLRRCDAVQPRILNGCSSMKYNFRILGIGDHMLERAFARILHDEDLVPTLIDRSNEIGTELSAPDRIAPYLVHEWDGQFRIAGIGLPTGQFFGHCARGILCPLFVAQQIDQGEGVFIGHTRQFCRCFFIEFNRAHMSPSEFCPLTGLNQQLQFCFGLEFAGRPAARGGLNRSLFLFLISLTPK